MAALQAVDKGTDNGLKSHWVNQSGFGWRLEEVRIRGGLGRGGDAVLRTEASDVALH